MKIPENTPDFVKHCYETNMIELPYVFTEKEIQPNNILLIDKISCPSGNLLQCGVLACKVCRVDKTTKTLTLELDEDKGNDVYTKYSYGYIDYDYYLRFRWIMFDRDYVL